MSRLAFTLLVAASVLAGRAAPPTAEQLFREPEVFRAELSPDGKQVVLVAGVDQSMTIYDVETQRRRTHATQFRDGQFTLPPIRVVDAQWVGPNDLLLKAHYSRADRNWDDFSRELMTRGFSGFAAVDSTGERWRVLPGAPLRNDQAFRPGYHPDLVWDSRKMFFHPTEPGVILTPAYAGQPGPHPDLMMIDIDAGTATVRVMNPGRITDWIYEWRGDGVLGVDGMGVTTKLLAPNKAARSWEEVADLGEARARLRFHLFDAATQTLFVSRRGEHGRWALGKFDLKGRRWHAPVVEHARYDIAPEESQPMRGPVDMSAVLFSPKTGQPMAVNYLTIGPRQDCRDPRLRAVQETLQSGDAGMSTFVLSVDREETRALLFSASARQPGFFSIAELATGKATRIAETMPWLSSAELADTYAVRVKTRDAAELDAYLTVPIGRVPKNGSLVILLRSEPWEREAPDFHPLAQFLAASGHAVLRVNYRGSSGYGLAFAEAGRKAIDGVLVDDVVDAARWAIERGVADPSRVAVVGTHFGGSTALLALARAPELFRCGVAIDGIADWSGLRKEDETPHYLHWFNTVALFDPRSPPEQLRACSPIAHWEKIRAPVMLANCESDSRAPIAGVEKLAALLKKAGRAPETFFYDTPRSRGYAISRVEAKQTDMYARVAAFLTRQLSPVTAGGNTPKSSAIPRP